MGEGRGRIGFCSLGGQAFGVIVGTTLDPTNDLGEG